MTNTTGKFELELNTAGTKAEVELTDTSISDPACGATISDLATSMRVGNVYANVHSVANPGGVIRGQVEPAGDD